MLQAADTKLPNALAGIDNVMFRIGGAAQLARIGEAVRDGCRAVQQLQSLVIQPESIAC